MFQRLQGDVPGSFLHDRTRTITNNLLYIFIAIAYHQYNQPTRYIIHNTQLI